MPITVVKKKAQAETIAIRLMGLVEYEQHGNPILATVILEKKGVWTVLNEFGAKVNLPSARLAVLGMQMPSEKKDSAAQVAFLQQTSAQADERAKQIALEELWEVTSEEPKEYLLGELAEFLRGDRVAEMHALRRSLVRDRIYFKRTSKGFEPRPAKVVAEMKEMMAREEEKQRQQQALLSPIIETLRGTPREIPKDIERFFEVAAIGKKSDAAADAQTFLDDIERRSGRTYQGNLAERMFSLLCDLELFDEDTNLAVLACGRRVEFSAEVLAETKVLSERGLKLDGLHDIRGMLIFSIDDASTEDIDDALSLETTPEGFHLGIHISLVAGAIPFGSCLEREVFLRGTSVYFPDEQIPMLPHELSEKLLSLQEGQDRRTMSFWFRCDKNWKVLESTIELSLSRVGHKLSYEQVDELLYGESSGSVPPIPVPLQSALLGLWECACSWERGRITRGAVQFVRRDIVPKILPGKEIIFVDQTSDSPARKLVGEMMIAANVAAAEFAKQNGIPLIFRGQAAPEVDPYAQGHDIPEGAAREFFQRSFLKRSETGPAAMFHSGLAASAYAHTTSPIRRAGDLVNQRQLAAFLQGEPLPYDAANVTELIQIIESRISEAQLLQRDRLRYWFLRSFQMKQIKFLTGTVLRVQGGKPLVELDEIFQVFPFRVQQGSNLKPGDSVQLRVERINPQRDDLILVGIENTAG